MRLTIRNSDGTVSQPMNLDWAAALEKLAAYEDAEDQRRMVVLPCKIGTPIWSSVMCRFDENGEEQPMQWPFMLSMMDEWGTGYFLTYDEAEAALKGGQDDGTA